jgi:hypothetical protein
VLETSLKARHIPISEHLSSVAPMLACGSCRRPDGITGSCEWHRDGRPVGGKRMRNREGD